MALVFVFREHGLAAQREQGHQVDEAGVVDHRQRPTASFLLTMLSLLDVVEVGADGDGDDMLIVDGVVIVGVAVVADRAWPYPVVRRRIWNTDLSTV